MRDGVYNEALLDDGGARVHYRALLGALKSLGPDGFGRRKARAEARLRELGATFPLDGEPDRVLPADWVPRVVPPEHWERLRAGLLQRGVAINAWLEDLPGQSLVPEAVLRSSVYGPEKPYPAGSCPVRVYGPDVVHLGGGEYVVLEDNVRMPSGVAYDEAIREAGRAAFEEAYAPFRLGEVTPYYEALRATLERAASSESPSVAVLTGGPEDPAFFEHRRISSACGLALLGPGDAAVRDGAFVSLADGRPFDVLYRRLDEDLMDGAFPGLRGLWLEGGVVLANAPGVGIADDKGVFPYVPGMIRHYLGEEPILSNAGTVSLAEPKERERTLRNLDEMVLKPREGYGGKGVLIGPEAEAGELHEAHREVEENPEGFVAQKALLFSAHVLDDAFCGGANGDGLEAAAAFVDLRAFVLPEAGYVLDGGLTRVARPGTRVVNSSSGGSFKDTWVLREGVGSRPGAGVGAKCGGGIW